MKGRPKAKAIDVWLPSLFPPSGPAGIVEGLDLTGWAAGGLSYWLRGSDRQWIGVCTLLVPRTDGGRIKFVDQLVPASAIRPRASLDQSSR